MPGLVVAAHIENMSLNPGNAFGSVVLLGRLTKTLSESWLSVIPKEVHEQLSQLVISILGSNNWDEPTRMYMTDVAAALSAIYAREGLWADFGTALLEICRSDEPLTASVGFECLAKCYNNGSLNIPELGGAISELISGIVMNDGCNPAVLPYGLRLIYALNEFRTFYPVIVQIMSRLEGEGLEMCVRDLNRELVERKLSPEAACLIDVINGVIGRSDLSIGGNVCAIELLGYIVYFFAEDMLSNVPGFVQRMFELICTDCEQISSEAAQQMCLLSQALGGTSQFVELITTTYLPMSSSPVPAIRRGVYIMLTNIFQECAIIFSVAMIPSLWEWIVSGFGDPIPEVRLAMYSFLKEFLKAYEKRHCDFDRSVVIPTLVEVIIRETTEEPLMELLKAFRHAIVFARKTLRDANVLVEMLMAMLTGYANPQIHNLAMKCVANIVGCVRTNFPNLTAFCCQICSDISRVESRDFFFQCLSILAFMAGQSGDVYVRVLEIVCVIGMEELTSSEIHILNRIIRWFVISYDEIVRIALESIVPVIIKGASQPIEALEFPSTVSNEIITDYIAVEHQNLNLTMCYDQSELNDKQEYMETLNTIAEKFGDVAVALVAPVCELIRTELFSYDPRIGLFNDTLNLCSVFMPYMDNPMIMLVFEWCAANIGTLAIEDAIESLKYIDTMCQIAVTRVDVRHLLWKIVINTAERSFESTCQTASRCERIADVRYNPTSTATDRTLINIVENMFRVYGGMPDIPWQSKLGFNPDIPFTVRLVSSCYIELEHDPQVLTALLGMVTNDENSHRTTTALEQLVKISGRGLFPAEALPELHARLATIEFTCVHVPALCLHLIATYHAVVDITPFIGIMERHQSPFIPLAAVPELVRAGIVALFQNHMDKIDPGLGEALQIMLKYC